MLLRCGIRMIFVATLVGVMWTATGHWSDAGWIDKKWKQARKDLSKIDPGPAIGKASRKIDPGPAIGEVLRDIDPGPAIGNAGRQLDPGPAIGALGRKIDRYVGERWVCFRDGFYLWVLSPEQFEAVKPVEVGGQFPRSGTTIVFVNGIMVDRKHAIAAGEALATRLQHPVMVVPSPPRGLLLDLETTYAGMVAEKSRNEAASTVVAAALGGALVEFVGRETANGRNVAICSHSRGSVIAYHAIAHLINHGASSKQLSWLSCGAPLGNAVGNRLGLAKYTPLCHDDDIVHRGLGKGDFSLGGIDAFGDHLFVKHYVPIIRRDMLIPACWMPRSPAEPRVNTTDQPSGPTAAAATSPARTGRPNPKGFTGPLTLRFQSELSGPAVRAEHNVWRFSLALDAPGGAPQIVDVRYDFTHRSLDSIDGVVTAETGYKKEWVGWGMPRVTVTVRFRDGSSRTKVVPLHKYRLGSDLTFAI